MRRDIQEDQVEGNLTFRPFSEQAFIDDLRTSHAVIAGGGFTLLSEAVYLHKPLLSIPVAKQFEQVLNARYVEKLGYGKMAPALTPEALDDFLGRIPACERALASYTHDGNERMKAALDEQLERAAGYYGNWEEDTQS